ncbi:Transcriptional regulator, MerR family [Tritonibacter mobilis]|uniref:MerR family transcriptional regulator n=1 Tax=Tritonibacter mobilis TaxID=379347 RepID=UPI000F6BA3CF|nr:MerR family transcriptional regulator [Tritonibacter mobilis]VCU59043.1 Transcriptional regulator, MerR family [Tritonibacter mobilis]
MSKSPDAFRTISEVAEWLDVPAHVLRFWESKFTQVKPVKRAGGRRYYRPTDMLLLGGIQNLLHDKGLSIKDAQALLREEGIQHVQSLSKPLDGEEEDESPIEAKPASKWVDPAAAEPEVEKPRRPVVDRESLGEEEHAPRKVAPPAPPPYPAGPPQAAPTPAAPGADAPQADVARPAPVETPLPASDTANAPASTSHEVAAPAPESLAPAAAAPQASEDVAPAGPVSDDDTPIADSTPSTAFEDMEVAPVAPSPTAAPQSDVAPQSTPAAPASTRPPIAPAASVGAAPAAQPAPASDAAQPLQPSLTADEPSETAPAELPQSELSAYDHPTDAPISAAPQEQAIDQIAMPFDLPDAPAPTRDVASQAQAIQQATSPASAPTSAASAPASSEQQDFFAAPPQQQTAPSPQSEPQSEELPADLPEDLTELGTGEAAPESQPMDVAPATEMRAPEVSEDLTAAEDVATEEVAPSFDAPPVDESVELPTEATPAADPVAENDFSSDTPDEIAETEFGATAEEEVTPEETVQVPEPAPSSDPAAEMAAAMATATAALSETPSVELEPDTPEFASDTTETDITDTDTDLTDADAENIFAAVDEPQDDAIADVETSLDAAAQSPLPEPDFTAPDQGVADDMDAEHAAPDVAEAPVSDMELGDSSTQPRPRMIEVSDTPTGDIPAGLLQRLSALNALSAAQQGELREIATALRGIIASR